MSAHKYANGLTLKQERFVAVYLETSNASEAYRQAYNSSNMQEDTIWSAASRLLAKSKVAARLEAIQAEIAQASALTREKQVDAHQRIAAKAEALGSEAGLSAADKAHVNTEKLLGWLTDKVEHSGSASFEMHLVRSEVKPTLVEHEPADE